MPLISWSERLSVGDSSTDRQTAVLNALRFDEPSAAGLARLTEDDWSWLLPLCDRQQLTLLLGFLHGPSLPPAVSERIQRNHRDNVSRFQKLSRDLDTILRILSAKGVEAAVLKGPTHTPDFVPDPLLRSQGDIDLWCPAPQILDAKVALIESGYSPIGKSRGRHLDPMIREIAWNWDGNYYNPDLPIPVDLHYRLWNARMERLSGPAEHEIWRRRQSLGIEGAPLAFRLSPVDTLAFAALHFLLHLLHGDTRLPRAWELGYFLHKNRDNDAFWREWQACYAREQRHLQTVPLALASLWFGCTLPEAVREAIEDLPANVTTWLKHCHLAPLQSVFGPGGTAKEDLWLHLALLNSVPSKAAVFFRRLIPMQAAARQAVQETQYNQGARRKTLSFLIRRAAHHLGALPATLAAGVRFWRACRAEPGR